jgi:hypothetical protein
MQRLIRLALLVAVVGGVQPACAQLTLAPKYVPGETSNTTEHVRFDQTLTLLGAAQVSGADMTYVIETSNGQPDGQGRVAIEQTFRSMVSEIRLPTGGTIRYDSANPAGNTSTDPQVQVLMDVFGALLDQPIAYRIDAQGKVVGMDGIKEIIRRAPEAAAKALEKELNEDRLKRDVQQELDALPRDAVKVGDTWMRTEVMDLGGGQTLTFDRKYEYAGEVDENGRKLHRVAIVDEKVVLAAPPEIPIKSSDLKIESSTGAVLIDLEQGRVVRRELNDTIAGSLVLNINGMEIPGELDLKVETKRTTE